MATEQIERLIPSPRRRVVIHPPSFSPLALLANVKRIGQYGDLLLTMSVHRIRVRYKQSALGIAWAILQPVSLMLIYTIIFSLFARMPDTGAPYALFAYAALLPWSSFSTALTNATNGLVSNSQLITKVYFPREILPLSYIIAALFDLLIASTVLAGLMIYYGVPLTLNLLYVVPIIAVMTMFLTAMALILSAMQVRLRDIGVAMPLLLQLWMFASPVIYPLDAVPAAWRSVYALNPMVGVIENFRRVVLGNAAPDWGSLLIAVAVSLVLLPIAYIYFKHTEATIADVI